MADVTKLAVLIDADNARATMIRPLLDEIAKYGIASVKRVYGDWTLPNLNPWKKVLNEHAIQPIQQFRYTVGKNSTDSAMIIDAMDLLYTGRFGGFCLISSDSDFTRLASRIREAGLLVYGFGERKTPESLRAACDRFIYLELLEKSVKVTKPPPAVKPTSKPGAQPPKDSKAANKANAITGAREANVPEQAQRSETGDQKPSEKFLLWLQEAVEATEDAQGRAHLGALGSLLIKQSPDFDPRTYGYKKLSELFSALQGFQVETIKSADGNSATHYVKSVKSVS